jgi:hypothetical protein
MTDAPTTGYEASVPPVPVAPPGPSDLEIVADVVLRVLGVALAFGGGLATAALAVLLIPLRVGSFGWPDGGGLAAFRLPVAIIVAVVGNMFLVWFARHATGVRWAALLPGIGWFTMIVVALRTTAEGDRLLMPDDWVGTLTLFGGTIVLVIATVLAVTQTGARTPYHRSS